MVRLGLAACFLLVGPGLAACQDTAPPDEGPGGTVVETASGEVRGLEHDGVLSWRGLPYAAPPVGDLRWRAPEPPEPWSEQRDAREYGPICLQAPAIDMSGPLEGAGGSSEDCLTLNVHRPAGVAADADLPVMVWIHGGGFLFGAGSQALFNGPGLVRRGVVLVTMNYRLGALGFLAHPALQEDGSRIGNFALLDQIAALQWVHDNIGSFGGDPSHVTIFGQSAGGMSVNALMVAPSARGLFSAAISQSGFGREAAPAWEEAGVLAQAAVDPLTGPEATPEELRALDGQTIMDNLVDGVTPVVDDVLPQSVSAAFAAGAEADVPYVVGSTDSEIPHAPAEQLGPEVGEVWSLLRGELGAETTAAYGSEELRDLYLGSDVLFTEPARFLARAHADDAPTYRYRFGIAQDTVLAANGGAPHSSELVFVFDDTRRLGTPVTDADALADQVAGLWVDFATDGQPAGWPSADNDEILTFTTAGPVVEADPWGKRLDVVEKAVEAAASVGTTDQVA